MEMGGSASHFDSSIKYGNAFLLLFALLVGNSAGGFAGRLAGSLAFAATALNGAFLQVGFVQSLYMFHKCFPPSFTYVIKT